VDSPIRADSREAAAWWQVKAALREAEVGNTASARLVATASLAMSPGREGNALLKEGALSLARTGDASKAKELAVELEKNHPTNTMEPAIGAAIELNKGNFSQALRDLQATVPCQLVYRYPAYLRRTTERRRQLNSRKCSITGASLETGSPGALAHLQLGRSYAVRGDTPKQEPLTRISSPYGKMPTPTPTSPSSRKTKAEYAKLQ